MKYSVSGLFNPTPIESLYDTKRSRTHVLSCSYGYLNPRYLFVLVFGRRKDNEIH